MAKVAPQMNMFVVGIQLKLLGGLVVMILMMSMLQGVANYITKEMQDVFLRAVEALKS